MPLQLRFLWGGHEAEETFFVFGFCFLLDRQLPREIPKEFTLYLLAEAISLLSLQGDFFPT